MTVAPMCVRRWFWFLACCEVANHFYGAGVGASQESRAGRTIFYRGLKRSSLVPYGLCRLSLSAPQAVHCCSATLHKKMNSEIITA